LDLKIFISSNAFYNPAFFYKQLELARFVFVLITDVLEPRSEVDTTGGTPIMLYNALELYFFLIVGGLYNSNKIKKRQDAPNGYYDQKHCDPERLSHLSLPFRIPSRIQIADTGKSKRNKELLQLTLIQRAQANWPLATALCHLWTVFGRCGAEGLADNEIANLFRHAADELEAATKDGEVEPAV
jgi:hypothetical protein